MTLRFHPDDIHIQFTYGSVKINVRDFNINGFRYSPSAAGDEKIKVPIFTVPELGSRPVDNRLRQAWGLAFKECPGKKSEF